MQCPECSSTHIRKNGKNRGKQNHICVACGRQFIDDYTARQGYSHEQKNFQQRPNSILTSVGLPHVHFGAVLEARRTGTNPEKASVTTVGESSGSCVLNHYLALPLSGV